MRKLSYLTDNLVPRSPRSCAGLRKWRLRDWPTRRAQEGPLKLPDERQSLKRKENWRKLLLLGIQTGDKLAKPPFFVAYSRLCRHCRNWPKEVVACRDFILGSVATFWAMSLVGIYPGRASYMVSVDGRKCMHAANCSLKQCRKCSSVFNHLKYLQLTKVISGPHEDQLLIFVKKAFFFSFWFGLTLHMLLSELNLTKVRRTWKKKP